MKRIKVSFRPLAEADLFALYRYIAKKSGLTAAGTSTNSPEE
jgi:plasmid stabilization system protein ParE